MDTWCRRMSTALILMSMLDMVLMSSSVSFWAISLSNATRNLVDRAPDDKISLGQNCCRPPRRVRVLTYPSTHSAKTVSFSQTKSAKDVSPSWDINENVRCGWKSSAPFLRAFSDAATNGDAWPVLMSNTWAISTAGSGTRRQTALAGSARAFAHWRRRGGGETDLDWACCPVRGWSPCARRPR